MDSFAAARQFSLEGRFSHALKALSESDGGLTKTETDVLKIEILERMGRYGQCRALAESLNKRRDLDDRNRSTCVFVLGLIELNSGNSAEAVAHFTQAVSLAVEAGDLERKCWFQLRLLMTIADYSGHESAVSTVREVKACALKLGVHRITAGLHIAIGEMEAKRGLLKSAEWHTRLGRQLLGNVRDLWLETVAENTEVALSILRSDLDSGFKHAEEGLRLAEECGAATMIRAALGNYGTLLLAAGKFDEATQYFKKAIAAMP